MMDELHRPYHPLANLFPLLEGDEYARFKADIAANGLREPICITPDGAILDGRNRHRACIETGTPMQFYTWHGNGSTVAYVLSLNLHRRHLNESQRAMVAAKLANMQLGDNQHTVASANLQTQPVSRADAADLLDVSERSVNAAAKVQRAAIPEVVAAVENGDLPVSVAAGLADQPDDFQAEVARKVKAGSKPADAVRETRRAATQRQLEDVAAVEAKTVQGVYDVIVIDPPWPMTKIERDERPNQNGTDYPTMTEAELCDLTIPAADTAHVWLWTTQKFLPLAFKLLAAWNLKYVCTFVWHKPGGFQPFGLPQYNCEFAIYAHRGAPEFIDTKAFNTCFAAPRGTHSEKPAEFYDTVRRVTAGRRLDMFARRSIPGFDAWGKEAPNA